MVRIFASRLGRLLLGVWVVMLVTSVSGVNLIPAASKHGGTTSTSSLNLVLLNSTDGSAHWGQTVTFSISTTATTEPNVSLHCYQNGALVSVMDQQRGQLHCRALLLQRHENNHPHLDEHPGIRLRTSESHPRMKRKRPQPALGPLESPSLKCQDFMSPKLKSWWFRRNCSIPLRCCRYSCRPVSTRRS